MTAPLTKQLPYEQLPKLPDFQTLLTMEFDDIWRGISPVALNPNDVLVEQSRAVMDYKKVDEYVVTMNDGTTFDPCYAIQDEDGKIYVPDGAHRTEAGRRSGTIILYRILAGSKADAVWLSTKANGKHGLPRTRDDMHRQIELALLHEYGATISNREIGRWIGCSHNTVEKIRKKLVESGQLDQIETRTVKRGDQEIQMDISGLQQEKVKCANCGKFFPPDQIAEHNGQKLHSDCYYAALNAKPEQSQKIKCSGCQYHRAKMNSHPGKLIGHYYHGKCIREDGLCDDVAAIVNPEPIEAPSLDAQELEHELSENWFFIEKDPDTARKTLQAIADKTRSGQQVLSNIYNQLKDDGLIAAGQKNDVRQACLRLLNWFELHDGPERIKPAKDFGPCAKCGKPLTGPGNFWYDHKHHDQAICDACWKPDTQTLITCESCGKPFPAGMPMLEMMDQESEKFLCDVCRQQSTVQEAQELGAQAEQHLEAHGITPILAVAEEEAYISRFKEGIVGRISEQGLDEILTTILNCKPELETVMEELIQPEPEQNFAFNAFDRDKLMRSGLRLIRPCWYEKELKVYTPVKTTVTGATYNGGSWKRLETFTTKKAMKARCKELEQEPDVIFESHEHQVNPPRIANTWNDLTDEQLKDAIKQAKHVLTLRHRPGQEGNMLAPWADVQIPEELLETQEEERA